MYIYQFLIFLLKFHETKIDKKYSNRSGIVLDTEYVTNVKTINLKINMLVQTFFVPSPAIQQ